MASRSIIHRLMRASQHGACPCHSCTSKNTASGITGAVQALSSGGASTRVATRNYARPIEQGLDKEYAFEMAASQLRFGPGVTREGQSNASVLRQVLIRM